MENDPSSLQSGTEAPKCYRSGPLRALPQLFELIQLKGVDKKEDKE